LIDKGLMTASGDFTELGKSAAYEAGYIID